jgi:hypothetical protein
MEQAAHQRKASPDLSGACRTAASCTTDLSADSGGSAIPEQRDQRALDQSPKRHKTGSPLRTLRVATYFGAFDPVHENHVRQVTAPSSCATFFLICHRLWLLASSSA